jgi:hypothetical protein
MQRLTDRCPRCDRPLGVSWDMWGRYYLCGGCGFAAEDDDDVHGRTGQPVPPLGPELTQIEAYRLWRTLPRE